MAPIKNLAWALFLAADLAAAHSVFTNAVGDAGGSGMALGVVSSTPRDGTRRQPFQADATRFRGSAADTVGETLGGGNNNIEQGTTNIMGETGDQLPQVTQGGSIEMTVHQVNADGAGPYTCMINADGTGTSWKNIQVTTNLEGNARGRNRAGAMGDFPLIASIPQGQTCTGSVAGEENVCLVRCQNPARAGPFGGIVPVQMAQNNGNANGDANAGNNNAGTGNDNANTGNNSNNNNNNANTGNNGNAKAGNNGNANTGNNNNANTGNANTNTGNGNSTTGANNQQGNAAQGAKNAVNRRSVSPRGLKSRPLRFSL